MQKCYIFKQTYISGITCTPQRKQASKSTEAKHISTGNLKDKNTYLSAKKEKVF
jgi:hypothetical protein